MRVELQRNLSAEELMLLNCGIGEDSWESIWPIQYRGSDHVPVWMKPKSGQIPLSAFRTLILGHQLHMMRLSHKERPHMGCQAKRPPLSSRPIIDLNHLPCRCTISDDQPNWAFWWDFSSVQFSSVAQSCLTLCDPKDCTTPGFPVHHQLLDLLRLVSIESVMPSNHFILCRPLLLPPSLFSIIRVFYKESALCIRWPKYWSFSFKRHSFQWLSRVYFL